MVAFKRNPAEVPRYWSKKQLARGNNGTLTEENGSTVIFIPHLFGRCKVSKRRDKDLDRPSDSLLSPCSKSRRRLRCHRYSSPGRSSRDSSVTAMKPAVFVVGVTMKQKFVVHPYVLARESDIFFHMLMSGRWATDKAIQIIDVTPMAFKLLLLSITGAEGVKGIQRYLTLRLALETYYAAHKYNLVELEHFLVKYIQRNSSHGNILELLDHSELYGLRVLEGYCWSVIERKALLIMQSDAFQGISWERLCAILENSRLAIKEFELFQAVMRWCAVELKKRQNRNKKNYEVLGIAVEKIRYPLLSPPEFAQVKWTGLLSSAQVFHLESNFRKNTKFCNKSRKYECTCRKMKMDCVLCTRSHGNANNVNGGGGGGGGGNLALRAAALDGRSVTTTVLRKSVSHRLGPRSRGRPSLLSLSRELNNNRDPTNPSEIAMSSRPLRICECIKYSSCPAFPNGSAASIMVAERINT